VERQRQQLEEQERQVALLRQRIAVLEGGDDQGMAKTNQRQGGSSVDDFSIKVGVLWFHRERAISPWCLSPAPSRALIPCMIANRMRRQSLRD
jgi:hypothetical protein